MLTFATFKEAFRAWQADHASYLAAAMSYHAVFSLAPLLVIALAIASAVYGSSATQAPFQNLVTSFFGSDVAGLLQQILEQQNLAARSGWALLIGSVVALVGAISGFQQLREAVNLIWQVKPIKRSFWATVWRYVLLSGLIGGTALLFLAFLIASAVFSQGGAFLQRVTGLSLAWLFPIANLVLSLGITTVLFALIFKYVPEVKISWKAVWPAAFITAILFNMGKFLIALYLGHSSVSSGYGAAGSLAIFLVWIFYEAQIFLYGVELVKHLEHKAHGSVTKTRLVASS